MIDKDFHVLFKASEVIIVRFRSEYLAGLDSFSFSQ